MEILLGLRFSWIGDLLRVGWTFGCEGDLAGLGICLGCTLVAWIGLGLGFGYLAVWRFAWVGDFLFWVELGWRFGWAGLG